MMVMRSLFISNYGMPDAASQASMDLEMDSRESRSESSDADGWGSGDVLVNTDMFFRPSDVSGRGFDGDAAMGYFSARGYSVRGHRLAAGEGRTSDCWKSQAALAGREL